MKSLFRSLFSPDSSCGSSYQHVACWVVRQHLNCKKSKYQPSQGTILAMVLYSKRMIIALTPEKQQAFGGAQRRIIGKVGRRLT